MFKGKLKYSPKRIYRWQISTSKDIQHNSSLGKWKLKPLYNGSKYLKCIIYTLYNV